MARRKKSRRAKRRVAPKGARLRLNRKVPRVAPTQRVTRLQSGQYQLEKVYVPKKKFRKGAMVLGKKPSTFVTIKSKPSVSIVVGCRPQDFKGGVCRATTIHKQIKKISAKQAKRLTGGRLPKALPKLRRKRRAANRRNTQLMVITNPCKRGVPVRKSMRRNRQPALARRAYKRFHFTEPQGSYRRMVPDGWPKTYMVIGECEGIDVQGADGRALKKRWSSKNRPTLACTAAGGTLYLFGRNALGVRPGRATQIYYRVPKHSGRNKWARRWYHPHRSHPAVSVHRGGRAARISGPGLSVTPAGIEG
jgi:hypothetical protein